MKEYAITTSDNPINPLDDPEAWFFYDMTILQYGTACLLARKAQISNSLSDAENTAIISDAIDDIVANIPAPNGEKYIKIERETTKLEPNPLL